MTTYLFRYHDAGKWWGLNIEAPSEAAAHAQVLALPHPQSRARYDGEMVASIPVPGFVARIVGRGRC